MFVVPGVAPNPVRVTHGLGCAGDNMEFILSQSDQGEIALEAAPLVEQPRVNGLAEGHVHVIAAEPLKETYGIRSLQDELGEAGLVENRDLLARGPVFGGVVGKPVLAAEGVFRQGALGKWRVVFRVACSQSRVGSGEPVRAFPAVFDTEAGSLRGEPFMQRGPAKTPAGLELAIWPGHLIVQPDHLRHAFAEKEPVVRPRAETPNIDGPKVNCRLSFDDPLGKIFSRAARARDADGVEA